MKTQTATKNSSCNGGVTGPQPAVILYVDDDPNDVELFRAATQRSGVPLVIHEAHSGEEALELLGRLTPHESEHSRKTPSLILLDLHLPRVNGVDVLHSIRSHPHTRRTPVVVLSGSDYSRDRQRALEAGAASFHVKPAGLMPLVDLVRNIVKEFCS